jgi:hypothetical protein
MRHRARPRACVTRGAAALTLIAGFLVLSSGTASAHGISGPRPSNYRSSVVSIEPSVEGLSVRTVDLGSKLELVNTSDTDVVVLGYQGEPYLRVGPRGVYENTRSPATYLNRTRQGTTRLPPEAQDVDPAAEPAWRKVSSGRTARWHDHRAHWMGTQAPPAVRAAPGDFHHIGKPWEVELRYGDRRVDVVGRLDWVPGPHPAPWLLLAGVLFAVALGAGLTRRYRPAMIVSLLVLVTLDAVHTIAAEAYRPGDTAAKVFQYLGTNVVSVVVWIAAIPTIVGLLRRRVEALYGVVLVAGMIALLGGISDLSALWKSQLPAAGPTALTRSIVAVSLGVGSATAVAAIVQLVRLRPQRAPAEHAEPWLSTLVAGLDEHELVAVAGELDVDEIAEAALADLSTRAQPAAPLFADGALGVAIADNGRSGPSRWTLVEVEGLVRARRGRADVERASLRITFPALLQLLAGTVTLEEAVGARHAEVEGDEQFVRAIAPYFSELDTTTAGDVPRSPTP